MTEINNSQVDDAHKIDKVMLMYNLIEYSDTYLKTSESLYQHYRNEPAVNANGEVTDFLAHSNNSAPFKFKQKIIGQTGNGGTKDVEIMVPLKYLSKSGEYLKCP